MKVDGNLGERLLQAIDLRGVQKQDVAAAARVTPATISQWLSGVTKAYKAEAVILAAQFLRVRVEWLLWGTGPMEQPAASEPAAELFSEAPEEAVQQALDFMEYNITKSIAADPRTLGRYLKLIDAIKKARKT